MRERIGTTLRTACFPILLLAVLVIAMAGVRGDETATAASGLAWERYDVTIDLLPTGAYHITERQTIRFEAGVYSSGFATLPLERIDTIRNIRIAEEKSGRSQPYEQIRWSSSDGPPGTFMTQLNSSDIELVWFFDETFNETKAFVLEYDVIGALRVYGDGLDRTQQIWWTAISQDVTDVAPVESSTVVINLTEPVDLGSSMLGEDGDQVASEHTNDGRTWRWDATDLGEGDEFTVRLEFPAIVDADAPAWQAIDDQSRKQDELREERQALYGSIFLAIGFLFAVLGGAGLYGLWYARGRDPHVGLVADFLAEPPDDLPPGAAGALVDEVAHERDIVATLVDLGRRGVLRIQELVGQSGVLGGRDFELELLAPETALTEFERSVVGAIFGSLSVGEKTRLRAAKSRFGGQAPTIKRRMYEELVKRGYFVSSPESTRQRWKGGGVALAVGLVLVFCVGGSMLTQLSPLVYFPLGIALIVAVALIFLSRVLPKKTLSGAEAAAKWRAFRTYLADIDRYGKASETQQIFDRYLPYAVAFGIEETWVRKFAAVGAEPPAWYGPVIVSGPEDWTRRHQPSRGGWSGGTVGWPSSRGDDGRGEGGFPDLQDMSNRTGRSLQGSSNSLFDMLNSAAGAFGSFSSGSGSSRRSSRSWGGSSGGFRGGGSRRGSSGGGRRGFR